MLHLAPHAKVPYSSHLYGMCTFDFGDCQGLPEHWLPPLWTSQPGAGQAHPAAGTPGDAPASPSQWAWSLSQFLCSMLGPLLLVAAPNNARFAIIDQCWLHHFQSRTAATSGHRAPEPCGQKLQESVIATLLPHHCIIHITLLVYLEDHRSVRKLFFI